jgi:OHCU decarboxylase
MTINVSQLSHAGFLQTFAGVFEHSPWIAEAVWTLGLGSEQNTPEGLHQAFADVTRNSSKEQQQALLLAHPDLAVAVDELSELTASSQSEQKGAGLDRCSPEEFAEFKELNSRYRKKFGFPFIMAVKGYDRRQILTQFRTRLSNSMEQEFPTAIEQVIRIGRFRIDKIYEEWK